MQKLILAVGKSSKLWVTIPNYKRLVLWTILIGLSILNLIHNNQFRDVMIINLYKKSFHNWTISKLLTQRRKLLIVLI